LDESAGVVDVTNTPANPPSSFNSVIIDDYDMFSSTYATRTFTPQEDGLVIDFWINVTNNDDMINLWPTNSTLYPSNRAIDVHITGSDLYWNDGVDQHIMTLNYNQWYRISLEIDVQAQQFDLAVDGDSKVQNGAFVNFVEDIDRIWIWTSGVGMSIEMFFDSFLAYNYSTSGNYTSGVTTAPNYITSVTPTWDSTLNGQGMTVRVSRDDGTTWAEVQRGEEYFFSAGEPLGKDLRYNVTMTSNGASTPYMDSISLKYSYTEPTFTITGTSVDDRFGSSIDSLASHIGDSTPELLVGAPLRNNGATADVGAAYVFDPDDFTSSSVPAASAEHILLGGAANDRLGHAVLSVPDLNGDGKNDIIITAPWKDNSVESGSVYLMNETDSTDYHTSGNYTSEVFDGGFAFNQWLRIDWTADVPASTDLKIYVRTGNSSDMSDATDWVECTSGMAPTTNHYRYIQWKANLTTSDQKETPTLYDLTITYQDTGMELELTDPSDPSVYKIFRQEYVVPSNSTSGTYTANIRAYEDNGVVDNWAVNFAV